jgi:DNA-directed RNA polymerase III subunit RPC1
VLDPANKGFSIGISDVTPGAALRAEKDSLVETAYKKSNGYIEDLAAGKLENQPGSGPEETLESVISGELSRVREAVGEICMRELSRNNAPLIMATCGSKGESALTP